MNTNLLCAFVATFLLAGGITLQAADSPALSNAVARAVAGKTLHFADDRVQQMCSEWPTCEEWVKRKVEEDPSFQIIDTEVERWVSKWENDEAVWEYRLYVQTRENNQIKAYLFTRGSEGFSYNAPIPIKHFPGHPFPDAPSEHVYTRYATKAPSILCEEWPGYHAWGRTQLLRRASASQYIYKWDEQENAVWEKNLYVEVGLIRLIRRKTKTEAFVFRAYQTEANGAFTYESPVEIRAYPEETWVSF